MSGGLEEKLLGEKAAGYCDSSDEEPDPGQAAGGPPAPPDSRWQGYSCNTGPKGVLRDWQLFKQHEEQTRVEKEIAFMSLCKEKAMTTTPYAEELKDEELMSEEIYNSFLKKRMNEMMEAHGVSLGKVAELADGGKFLEAVDNAPKSIFIVVHIYEPGDALCRKMNECLDEVAASHASNAGVKFAKAVASKLEISQSFKSKGVPALLVYKGGDLVGNFVGIKEQIGDDFFPSDIENFLVEQGVIDESGTRATIP